MHENFQTLCFVKYILWEFEPLTTHFPREDVYYTVAVFAKHAFFSETNKNKNVFAITCVKTTQMSSFFQWIIIWWMWTYSECILKIWVDDVIFWRHYIFPHFRGLKRKSDDVRKWRHQLRFSKYFQGMFTFIIW